MTHFTRELSEKLIEKGIRWESGKRWYRHHDDPNILKEVIADDCTDFYCGCSCDTEHEYPEKLEPALTLETALTRPFLEQIQPEGFIDFPKANHRDISDAYFDGGYPAAEKVLLEIISNK